LSRARGRWRWLAGVAGAALLVAGVAVLFGSDQEARSAFLLAVGLALTLVAALGERLQLESFAVFGASVRVRDVVKRRLELAESPQVAQPVDASALRSQAAMLQTLVSLHGLYEHVRRTEPASDRRTQALDALAARMQEAGRNADFDATEVIAWFHEGTDSLRVIVLNLMLANAEYRDLLPVLETIDAPRSLFEQYYGLRVAAAMLPELGPLERRLLHDAIERARRKRRFRRDAPLMHLSGYLLEQSGKVTPA